MGAGGGGEEGAEEVVGRCFCEEGVHEEGAFAGGGGGHGEPALEHAEGGGGADAVVEVRDGEEPAAGFPGVEVLPAALPDGVVDAAEAVAVFVPALYAAAVDVRAEGEARVAGEAHAEAVGVGDGVAG